MQLSKKTILSLRFVALAYLLILVVVPIATILVRTFAPGLGQFWAWITTPAAISALQTSLLIVAITVPLNVVFGIIVSLALARGDFRGKGIIHSLVDLPFAVSPIIVGASLVLLWGAGGWFGGLEELGIRIIYALPAMIIATVFGTMPFIVREVEPVLREIGTEQEQAAATLGASPWQTFFLVTLPSIRWGLTYGVVLTVARALGEFGAVIMVASNFAGGGQTLTLLVHSRYIDDHNEYGAYAAATLLMAVSVLVLIVMTAIQNRQDKKQNEHRS